MVDGLADDGGWNGALVSEGCTHDIIEIEMTGLPNSSIRNWNRNWDLAPPPDHKTV